MCCFVFVLRPPYVPLLSLPLLKGPTNSKVVAPNVAALLSDLDVLPEVPLDADDDVTDEEEDVPAQPPPFAPPPAGDPALLLFMDEGDFVEAPVEPMLEPEAAAGEAGVLVERVVDVVGDKWAMAVHSGQRTADEDLDLETTRVASHLIVEKLHVNSTTAEAAALAVDRRKLRETQIVLADAGWQLERAGWRRVERDFVDSPTATVDLMVNYAMYDGVDLKLASKNFWNRVAERAPVEGMLEDKNAVQALVDDLRNKQPVEVQLGMAKLLHMRQAVAMVIRIGEERCYLLGTIGSLLVGLDRSTAEAILGALLRQDPCGEAADRAKRKLRLTESDEAGYNPRAERGYVQQRRGWIPLRFGCEIHYTSGTHVKVYDAAPLDVSGMANAGLAL